MQKVPNIFTLLNLFFGSIAIIYILQNGIIIVSSEEGTQLLEIPEKIWLASLFIGLAAAVDFLDGFIARLFKATSVMGKQLDSLADVVSFGVAPGLILYQFLRLSFAKEEGGIETSLLWLLPALFVPCAAAFRLARFNIDAEQQGDFKGVPTPAVGLLIASFPLIYWYYDSEIIINVLTNKWFLYAFIFIVCYLMVSHVPFMAFKFNDFSLKNNLPKIIFLVLAVIAAALLKWLAVPLIFLLYIILSLSFKNKKT